MGVRSIGLRLMALCIPLLTGCSGGGDAGTSSPTDPAFAQASNGNGKEHGPDPTISLSPTGLSFSATQGDSTSPPRTVSISNSGNGKLNWSVSTTAEWLSLSAVSGSVSGNASDSFTATANISGIAAGTYSTTITVTATDATNTPQSIPVDLIIATSTPTTPTSTTSTPTTVAVSLAWDPSPDPSVVGYHVHYGLQSPNSPGSCAYSNSTYASSPTATISGLATGTTYYFAVSASNGLESPCSNEVAKAA